MKLGIFTDSHYSSHALTGGNRYNNQSLRKIREAYAAFEEAHCDLIICLGDLTDIEDSHQKEADNLREIAKIIQASLLPTICLMGNHDAFAFEKDEFYDILGGCIPENREICGKQLIFIDACYFGNGTHYTPDDDPSRWKETCCPFADELKQELAETQQETYVFVHQNIDPNVREDHRLDNSAQIFEILQSSGNVKAVFQGHYHPGKESEYDGIRYMTFPAMCERENAFFILTL